ncbi:hypothetical protein DFJ73DRAFT_837688 [Zopfochytrium polystomum]|nr:hypothetical protein DFJ73DRAFT_837688 [Zopfochytrium polystomum]
MNSKSEQTRNFPLIKIVCPNGVVVVAVRAVIARAVVLPSKSQHVHHLHSDHLQFCKCWPLDCGSVPFSRDPSRSTSVQHPGKDNSGGCRQSGQCLQTASGASRCNMRLVLAVSVPALLQLGLLPRPSNLLILARMLQRSVFLAFLWTNQLPLSTDCLSCLREPTCGRGSTHPRVLKVTLANRTRANTTRSRAVVHACYRCNSLFHTVR